MSSPGRFYASPSADEVRLDIEPRLASWNAAAHPDQVKLHHAGKVLSKPLSSLGGLVALRLNVELPHVPNLCTAHDLDNYAYPLAKALTGFADQQIISVWCAKSQRSGSTLAVADAEAVSRPAFARLVEARTSASTETPEYKQQIHDQVPPTAMLPPGPIAMQIAFTVSPKRNWTNLWKPTIDSLDALLGRTSPARDWHPLDGRIVELGLHCTYDPGIGNDVELVIGASSADDRKSDAERVVDIPTATASEPQLNQFAVAYDAYALHGDVSAIAAFHNYISNRWTETGDVGDHVDNLRTTLFFAQRVLHHTDGSPLTENPLVLAILARLRELAPDGVPVIA